MYDEVKVATVAAFVTPLLLLVAGYGSSLLRLFWLGSLLPGLVAGAAVRYFPELRAWWHGSMLPLRSKWAQEDQQGHSWEADWVRAYGTRGRSQDRRRESPPSGSRAAAEGLHGDPKGYYRLLGVPPSASTSEIQAAFRAAAFKHHPDHAGLREADKARATAAFQRALEAYGTLRDPQKRRAYDQG